MIKVKKRKQAGIKSNIPAAAVIAVIIIAIIISAAVSIYNDNHHDQSFYSFSKAVANGIDVSEHNGEIDWEAVSRTQDFAFIRVGYRGYGNGEIVEDKNAVKNLKGAEKAGIPCGVYFYTQAVTEDEARREADFVYYIIKRYNVQLPVIIDFEFPEDDEGNAVGRLVDAATDKRTNTEIVNAFIEEMQSKGYISGVYASSSVLKNHLNIKGLPSGSFVWAADYNGKVGYDIDYTVWQYSKTGECDGVESRYVDLNYWYGS